MAPQPTNPQQPSATTPKIGGVQLPRFDLNSASAAHPQQLGDTISLNNNYPAPSAQKTLAAPRLHPENPRLEQLQSPILSDFRLPLKRVGFLMGTLLISTLLISLIVNALAGFWQRITTPPTITTTQALSSTVANSATTPGSELSKYSSATTDTDTNACIGIPTKMQTAQVTNQQVNRVFWQKHPEISNKDLDLSAVTDRDLRQEWCQIAGELSTKP